MAKGIQILHNKGIVHRDLKPQNILLKDKQIKICDFGHSIKINNEKIKGMVGTLNYMAPEIFEYYDEKVDIWAYGCLLYKLATGR